GRCLRRVCHQWGPDPRDVWSRHRECRPPRCDRDQDAPAPGRPSAPRPDDLGAPTVARSNAPQAGDRARTKPDCPALARAGVRGGIMTDKRTLDRLIAHLRGQVAELRRLERDGARPEDIAARKRLVLRLQERLAYVVRDLVSVPQTSLT